MSLKPNKQTGYGARSRRRSIRDVCLRSIVTEPQATIVALPRRKLSNRPLAALLKKQDSSMSIMSGSTEGESSYGSLESSPTSKILAASSATAASMMSLNNSTCFDTSSIMSAASECSKDHATLIRRRDRNNNNNKKEKRRVVFSTAMEIREYDLILGDNPSASYPLALDWAHTETRVVDALLYDQVHNDDDDVDNHKLTHKIQRLPANSRIDRLVSMGWNKKTLRAMERDRKMELVQEWSTVKAGEDDDDVLPPPPRVIRID